MEFRSTQYVKLQGLVVSHKSTDGDIGNVVIYVFVELCTQEDLFAAVSDIRSVNRLEQDSTEGYYELATLLYKLGHVSDSLKVCVSNLIEWFVSLTLQQLVSTLYLQ